MVKKIKAVLLGTILLVMTAQFCVASAAAQSINIGTIRNRDWILQEVRIGTATVKIDRTGTANENSIYTIRFDADRISGTGAPNRFFAPYTATGNSALSIGMIAGTLMAPLFERSDLRERDYFNYLQKIYRWSLINGKLELYTLDDKNLEVILIYSE